MNEKSVMEMIDGIVRERFAIPESEIDDENRKKKLYLENKIKDVEITDKIIITIDTGKETVEFDKLDEYDVIDLIHLRDFLEKQMKDGSVFDFYKQGSLDFWKQKKVRALLRIIKKWDDAGFKVKVLGSVTCPSCDIGIPLDMLEGTGDNVYDKFPHGKDCPKAN